MTNTSSASAVARLANFTAALLAPLPDGIEPVDTRPFRRSMLDAEKEQWHMLMLKALACKAYRDAAHLLSLRALHLFPDTYVDRCAIQEECERAYWRACDDLMVTPAPTIRALRWKQGHRAFLGGAASWEAQIAADVARLEAK